MPFPIREQRIPVDIYHCTVEKYVICDMCHSYVQLGKQYFVLTRKSNNPGKKGCGNCCNNRHDAWSKLDQ